MTNPHQSKVVRNSLRCCLSEYVAVWIVCHKFDALIVHKTVHIDHVENSKNASNLSISR